MKSWKNGHRSNVCHQQTSLTSLILNLGLTFFSAKPVLPSASCCYIYVWIHQGLHRYLLKNFPHSLNLYSICRSPLEAAARLQQQRRDVLSPRWRCSPHAKFSRIKKSAALIVEQNFHQPSLRIQLVFSPSIKQMADKIVNIFASY